MKNQEDLSDFDRGEHGLLKGRVFFFLSLHHRTEPARENIQPVRVQKMHGMFYFVVFRFLPFLNKKKTSFFVIFCFAAAARAARPNEDKLRKRGRFNLFFIPVTCLRSAAIFSCLSLSLSVHHGRCGPITVKFN